MNVKTLKALGLFLGIFLVICLVAWWYVPDPAEGGTVGSERIALVYAEGMITAARAQATMLGGAGGASSITICRELYEARDDSSVAGVVLRINSPGGSAAASDEIYHAVASVSEVKPVVVSMGDVAASGGYYISSPADYIFANGATLTGSIGVVFQLINWQALAEKIGIEDTTLTAGDFKDIGSPWREMTDVEREQMTTLMTQVHDQFIAAITAGRDNLEEAQVRELANGMVYTGETAVANGLVDGLGGLHAAEEKCRELAGVGADVPVESLHQPKSILEEILGFGASGSSHPLLSPVLKDPLMGIAGGLYLNSTLRDIIMR